MNELFLIESLLDVKEVFGSIQILEDAEIVDVISIVSFAKIVSNYLKMDRILNS